MELVKPAFGLVFWMIVSFSIILFILKKFELKNRMTGMVSNEMGMKYPALPVQRGNRESHVIRFSISFLRKRKASTHIRR